VFDVTVALIALDGTERLSRRITRWLAPSDRNATLAEHANTTTNTTTTSSATQGTLNV
jgi:hypothetical protein